MDEPSHQSDTLNQKRLLTPKRKVLIGFVVWSLVYTVADLILEKTGADQFRMVAWAVGTIGYGVLILAWTNADSRERGEALSHGWKFMLVAFGAVALVAYLFKSRGFAKGLLAVLYAVAFMVFIVIFNTLLLTIGMIAAGK